MKHPVNRLRSELDEVLNLLSWGSFFSFTAEEKRTLENEGKDLFQKLESIESSFLTIGLLGGTGVGKSTLMNALAGSEITSTSHRRPHTEQVLIYRHLEANPPPALPLKDIPWQEITHQGDPIRYILLCDLPDFDSLIGEHRQHVMDFLEYLDILVWVTSPEKYADGRFYEFLQQVPKAKQNFYFVLNKVDLLFEGDAPKAGYEQLERMVRSFHEHIKENGIAEPILYSVSAEAALNPDSAPLWNQFLTFRQQIFQQRDIKQITAIKAANLDVEVQRLLSAFQKELANLEMFEQILESSMNELREQRSLWIKAGQDAIDLWLRKYIQRDILTNQGDPSMLVGPGYGIALALEEWQQRFTKAKNIPLELSHFSLPDDISVTFKRRLEWLDERINHRILHQKLPTSFREKLQEILDLTKVFEDLGERFSYVLALKVAEPSLPSFLGFRGVQYLTYALLLAFLLLALGGEAAWRQVLEAPGGANLLRLLTSGIQTLFSAKGLAALGSYVLLNFFLAFRFYRRYKRRLGRATQKVIETLGLALGKVWQEKLDSILDDLDGFRLEIQSRMSSIFTLGGGQA